MQLQLVRPSYCTSIDSGPNHWAHFGKTKGGLEPAEPYASYAPGLSYRGLKLICKGLLKQSRPNHIRPPLFVQRCQGDPLIYPVQCFEAYVTRTREFRSLNNCGLLEPNQLFLGIFCPHAPIKACSIARWVKTTLANAGIDVTRYSAHSIRGASTSKALESGATLSEVVQQAGWSKATAFHNFYFRSSQVRSLSFTHAVLSSAHTSNLHADIEPEHSEV